MAYFYCTISGGGVIEASNVEEAKEIIKKHAGCYSSVVQSYECDKEGIALSQCSDCGKDLPAPYLICSDCADIEATQEDGLQALLQYYLESSFGYDEDGELDNDFGYY